MLENQARSADRKGNILLPLGGGFLPPLSTLALSSRDKNALTQAQREALLEKVRGAKLNDQQIEATTHLTGPMLVLAGAGTGKTRVVTNRIAHLIGMGVRPRRILAVTFTNKAREEMSDRCATIIKPYTSARPTVLTLHSLGFRILRMHAAVLGYRNNPQIVSDVYQDRFFQRALAKLGSEALGQLGRDPVADLKAQIGLLKSLLRGPADLIAENHPMAPAYVEYQKWLQRSGVIDCDDLLRLPVGILRHEKFGADILAQWRSRFDYILVDEYQDTNKAQFELLRLLAGEHRNLFVVGDDDQSIYGWRAADVGLIREFSSHWPDAKQVTLDRNYRSTQPILDLGNQVMSREPGRFLKVLKAVKGGGENPVVHQFGSDVAEAKWIVAEIVRQKLGHGTVAIILRNQFRMAPIEKALVAANIPYEVWRNDQFQMGEVKLNVYAMLAAIHDPEKEEPAFIQLLESSTFSVDSEDYEKIMLRRDSGNESVWQILNSRYIDDLSEGGRENICRLRALIHELHTALCHQGQGKPSLFEISRRAMAGLYPEAGSEKEWTQGDSADASEITKILRTISGYVASYERRAERPTLRSFLGYLEYLRRKAKEPLATETQATGAVVVATIHSVKGLEFDHVFLPALNEETLPSLQAISSNDESKLAEERRLFYVAVTRARKQVFLSWHTGGSGRRSAVAKFMSRYIIESGADKFLTDHNMMHGGSDGQGRLSYDGAVQ